MMGWADEFILLDKYLHWLTAGMPANAQTKGLEEQFEVEKEDRFLRIFSHKGIDLDGSPLRQISAVFGEICQWFFPNQKRE